MALEQLAAEHADLDLVGRGMGRQVHRRGKRGRKLQDGKDCQESKHAVLSWHSVGVRILS